MTRRSERRRQRRLLRKVIDPKVAIIEDNIRTNADTFVADGFDVPYVAAAYYVVEQFVSKSVADEYWISEGGTMSAENAARLVTLGETLFRLRHTPGLLEFCQRIGERTPRAPFYNEALTASVFLDHGFSIRALGESGTKGLDFDFSAKKDGEVVCVEVTTLRPTSFSERTVANALKAKLSQLPKARPNVVTCYIPEAWYAEDHAIARLVREARRLFGKSQRVNAVIFIGEQHNDLTIGGRAYGVLQYRFTSVRNEKARNACEALNFLATMEGEDLVVGGKLRDLTDQRDLHRSARGTRDFFRWVDTLIARDAHQSPDSA